MELKESRNLVLPVFLMGMGVIIFELALTRIFSVIMWYHFASLSIALALFGFAFGGVVVFLRPTLISGEKLPECLFVFAAVFAAGSVLPFLFLWFANSRPEILFPIVSFFHQPYFQPFRQVSAGPDASMLLILFLIYSAISLPFISAGIFFAGLFMRASSKKIGILYGADLAGASLGCLLLVPGLGIAGAPSLILVACALALGSAAALVVGRWRLITISLAALVLVGAAVNGPNDLLVGMKFARGQYEPDIRFSRWNAISRVVVYPLNSWEARQAWGISRRYTGPVPDNMAMLVDDAGYTPIIANPGSSTSPAWASYHIISLPYVLRPGASVAIIGPGGGRDILAALGNSAGDVTAIKLNPLIVEAVEERFRDFSGGPYSLPGVRKIIGEGRTELAKARKSFDIIQTSSVFGETSPAAGAFSLSANFLYTREAFSEYWDLLTEDGILSFSRAVFGRRALRLTVLARDLVLNRGIATPEESIAVFRERGLATVLITRSGFSADDLKLLSEFAGSRGFKVEVFPGRVTGSVFEKVVRGEDITGGRFDLSPPTDDRPFFYNNVPTSRFLNIFFKPRETGERHIVILRTLSIIMLVFVIVLVIIGFSASTRVEEGLAPFFIARSSAYFAGIGLGYMFFELTMMHRLTLFLGNPTYALSVVLVILLLSSSAGSITTSRWDLHSGRNYIWLTVALILLLVTVWFAADLLRPALGASLAVRVVLAGILIAPPGFVMGMFMPLGLRAVTLTSPRIIPWAWALNGAASVAGSLGTLVIAMNFGYSRAFAVCIASYLLTLPFLGTLSGNRSHKVISARKEVAR